ncbi:MAG: hypothetical protein QOE63_1920, partial [Acidimicrobiaceae bacterium]
TAAHLSIGAAALAIARGDDDGAAQLLTDEIAVRGLLRGLSASAQCRTLALWYVLVPSSRPTWDGADLGPANLEARALARTLVDLRERDDLDAVKGLRLPAPSVTRSHLPVAWAAELAVALTAVGRPEGDQLLDEVWPVARPAVRALADDGNRAKLSKAAKQVLARLPAPPPHKLALSLLGPIGLAVVDDARVSSATVAPEWRRERVRTLLTYLAVHQRATRERVAADLWPELDAAGGGRNLRVTLAYLHRVLEPDRGEGDAPFFVRQDGGTLELRAEGWLAVDMWRFDELLDEAAAFERAGMPSLALHAYEGALALWQGDPLAGIYDEWAIDGAERLRRRCARAAVRCGELVLAHGDTDRALALADQALGLEAWAEPAHRLVVSAHLARHDRGAARRALDHYRKLLSELGTTPDEATRVLERLLDTDD